MGVALRDLTEWKEGVLLILKMYHFYRKSFGKVDVLFKIGPVHFSRTWRNAVLLYREALKIWAPNEEVVLRIVR